MESRRPPFFPPTSDVRPFEVPAPSSRYVFFSPSLAAPNSRIKAVTSNGPPSAFFHLAQAEGPLSFPPALVSHVGELTRGDRFPLFYVLSVFSYTVETAAFFFFFFLWTRSPPGDLRDTPMADYVFHLCLPLRPTIYFFSAFRQAKPPFVPPIEGIVPITSLVLGRLTTFSDFASSPPLQIHHSLCHEFSVTIAPLWFVVVSPFFASQSSTKPRTGVTPLTSAFQPLFSLFAKSLFSPVSQGHPCVPLRVLFIYRLGVSIFPTAFPPCSISYFRLPPLVSASRPRSFSPP